MAFSPFEFLFFYLNNNRAKPSFVSSVIIVTILPLWLFKFTLAYQSNTFWSHGPPLTKIIFGCKGCIFFLVIINNSVGQ